MTDLTSREKQIAEIAFMEGYRNGYAENWLSTVETYRGPKRCAADWFADYNSKKLFANVPNDTTKQQQSMKVEFIIHGFGNLRAEGPVPQVVGCITQFWARFPNPSQDSEPGNDAQP